MCLSLLSTSNYDLTKGLFSIFSKGKLLIFSEKVLLALLK
jgi:hypothetical protein